MVKDIHPDDDGWVTCNCGDSREGALQSVGNTLYFSARDGVHGAELWRTDGTARGTRLVADVASNGASAPVSLTRAGQELYFKADSTHGGASYEYDLLRTDGTRSGTELVQADVPTRPVPMSRAVYYGLEGWLRRASSDPPSNEPIDQFADGPFELANVDQTLFFTARDSYGYELWRSDGTQGGATLVEDLNPEPFEATRGSGFPQEITDAAGTPFYFTARDGVHARELWRSNGTAGGTYLVRDIDPSGSSRPSELTRFDPP